MNPNTDGTVPADDSELPDYWHLARAYLDEHARREALPRQVCPDCQFEYSAEDTHVCKST